jgi:hypothetical protein
MFLSLEDDDTLKQINIDDLYEKKQKRDLKQLSIFNKVLNRIHTRINLTSKTKKNDRHIWYIIPEYIFGEPLFDNADCIAYIISKLEENGFFIKFIYPNTLFISWENWVPSYVRNEIKKKSGIVLNEKGEIIKKITDEGENIGEEQQNDSKKNNGGSSSSSTPKFNPITNYKPSGKLIYNNELFEHIEKKVSHIS